MKKKVLILDAFSYLHIGNGALLDDSVKALEMTGEELDIFVHSKDFKNIRERYPRSDYAWYERRWENKGRFGKYWWILTNHIFILLQILNELTFKVNPLFFCLNKTQKQAFRQILDSDVCISINGESINDGMRRTLPTLLFTYWFAIRKKKKMILFPQSIGPLESKFYQRMVYKALKDAKLMVGRDAESFKKLKELGFKEEQIMFSIDVAVLQGILPKEEVPIERYFITSNKKTVGVTISQFPKEVEHNVDIMREIVSSINETLSPAEYRILVMPSNYVENGVSPDYKLCTRIYEELSKRYDTAILENKMHYTDEYTTLLSQLDFFITTRMHVMILATSQSTPTIAICSQHKIKGYMQNIDMGEYAIYPAEIANLQEKIAYVKDNRDAVSQKIHDNVEKLRRDSLYPFIERLKGIIAS